METQAAKSKLRSNTLDENKELTTRERIGRKFSFLNTLALVILALGAVTLLFK
jgi:hypothetical protein